MGNGWTTAVHKENRAGPELGWVRKVGDAVERRLVRSAHEVGSSCARPQSHFCCGLNGDRQGPGDEEKR